MRKDTNQGCIRKNVIEQFVIKNPEENLYWMDIEEKLKSINSSNDQIKYLQKIKNSISHDVLFFKKTLEYGAFFDLGRPQDHDPLILKRRASDLKFKLDRLEDILKHVNCELEYLNTQLNMKQRVGDIGFKQNKSKKSLNDNYPGYHGLPKGSYENTKKLHMSDMLSITGFKCEKTLMNHFKKHGGEGVYFQRDLHLVGRPIFSHQRVFDNFLKKANINKIS